MGFEPTAAILPGSHTSKGASRASSLWGALPLSYKSGEPDEGGFEPPTSPLIWKRLRDSNPLGLA